MKEKPFLTTACTVRIFEKMLSLRRYFSADNSFFRMDELWEDLCDEEGRWKINTYQFEGAGDAERKAAVVAFGDKVTLSVDEKLMAKAKRGCQFSNFILAHELGHVALGHLERSAVTKNFRLSVGPRGLSNLPPTLEELEANFAAVFLQCGVALLDRLWDPIPLASRAFSDRNYVKKAVGIVRLEVFKRELLRSKLTFPRIVL